MAPTKDMKPTHLFAFDRRLANGLLIREGKEGWEGNGPEI